MGGNSTNDCAAARDRLLDLDEAPELARHEVVHVPAALIVERLAANRRRPLERILWLLMFSRIGMLMGTFGPGHPFGCW